MAAALCGWRFGARSGWSRDWHGFSETDLIQNFCMSGAFLIKSSGDSPQGTCGEMIGLSEWILMVNIELPFKKNSKFRFAYLIYDQTLSPGKKMLPVNSDKEDLRFESHMSKINQIRVTCDCILNVKFWFSLLIFKACRHLCTCSCMWKDLLTFSHV